MKTPMRHLQRFLLAVTLLLPASISAQNELGLSLIEGDYLLGSRLTPATLNLGEKNVEIVTSAYLWAGNTTLEYGLVTDYLDGRLMSAADKEDFLRFTNEDNNLLGFGLTGMPLGVAFRVARETDYPVDISLSLTERMGMSLDFSEKLLELMFYGNKRFAGQTIQVGPLDLNANQLREYAIGAAAPILPEGNNDWLTHLRAGLRLKFLQGIYSVYMPGSDVEMTTSADGRYIDFDFDYGINLAGAGSDYQFFNGVGFGVGVDLSVAAEFTRSISASLSVLDIGGVRYRDNTLRYEERGFQRYDGLYFGGLFGDDDLENLDTLIYVFEPEEVEGADYRMPLPSRMVLQGKWNITEDEEYPSEVSLTYIQGFNNMPGATVRPFVNVGYRQGVTEWFDVAASLGLGGYNNLSVGTYLAFRIDGVAGIYFGFDNLTGLVVPRRASGADLMAGGMLRF